MTSYHPIVFWGQSKDYILLSVKVMHAKNVSIDIGEESIIFNTEGEGSNGLNSYNFNIRYYLPIIPKDSFWEVKDSCIEIKLKKELKDPWLRLSDSVVKFPWLKCDFNNICDESDYESENSSKDFKELIKGSTQGPLDNKEKYNAYDKLIGEIMKPLHLYLLIYNLFQFAGYLFVFGSCVWIASYRGLYDNTFLFPLIRDQLITIQLASILEIFHAYLGWVKSNSISVLMQVFGRNMVLFLIILPHGELQKDQDLFVLLFAWSCIEIIRYPYYLLIMLHEKVDFLTWLRYTIWIPLYPIGFMAEGKLILKAIPYLQQTKKFSFFLPNIWNMQFDFVGFLYIYIPLTLYGFYNLMMYMYSQRKLKIGPSLKNNWNSYNFLQFLIDTLKPKKKAYNVSSKNPAINSNSANVMFNDCKVKN